MSRIGKKIITLPEQINVKIEDSVIIISGPKGELKHHISPQIKVDFNSNQNTINVKKLSNTKKAQALHGLHRSIINNMVIGVSKGFEKKLIINELQMKFF